MDDHMHILQMTIYEAIHGVNREKAPPIKLYDFTYEVGSGGDRLPRLLLRSDNTFRQDCLVIKIPHSMKPLRGTLCPLALSGRFDGLFICSRCFFGVRETTFPAVLLLFQEINKNRTVQGRGCTAGHSFVSLYHEPHSTDVFSRRRRRTTLTQIVTEATFVKTRNGRPALCVEGYKFYVRGFQKMRRRDYESKRMRWRCVSFTRGCKGFAVTQNRAVIEMSQNHNHPADRKSNVDYENEKMRWRCAHNARGCRGYAITQNRAVVELSEDHNHPADIYGHTRSTELRIGCCPIARNDGATDLSSNNKRNEASTRSYFLTIGNSSDRASHLTLRGPCPPRIQGPSPRDNKYSLLSFIDEIFFTTTQRGQRALWLKGYKFTTHYGYDRKMRWLCSHRQGCRAYVYTIDDVVVKTKNEHTHQRPIQEGHGGHDPPWSESLS
ncbi:hypothetical protein EVAR_17879_1 [Eumeta japonica]|uniref:FLYWCH-type domain-containing protein n=1 Tax=Eumeta variegata TaxID=151549 RepID=A0A4C1UY26_EUMVA|nr:hypothetical protein EVAR_17879_1 [Eumeta japonica]